MGPVNLVACVALDVWWILYSFYLGMWEGEGIVLRVSRLGRGPRWENPYPGGVESSTAPVVYSVNGCRIRLVRVRRVVRFLLQDVHRCRRSRI